MDALHISLRVTAPDPDVARVSVGRRQFSIGRPLEFDEASPRVAAIEYALGAVGGEIVNGLREFADRRRLPIDAVEAVVTGELDERADLPRGRRRTGAAEDRAHSRQGLRRAPETVPSPAPCSSTCSTGCRSCARCGRRCRMTIELDLTS